MYPAVTVFPAVVGGYDVLAMADSGATITVVSPRLATWLLTNGRATARDCHEEVEVFEGGKVILTKILHVFIACGTKCAEFQVYVSNSKRLPFDICVGDDFFRLTKGRIDWATNTVRAFDQEIDKMTRTQIATKKNQLDMAFQTRDFREAGAVTMPH